jgi:hypothetical protein
VNKEGEVNCREKRMPGLSYTCSFFFLGFLHLREKPVLIELLNSLPLYNNNNNNNFVLFKMYTTNNTFYCSHRSLSANAVFAKSGSIFTHEFSQQFVVSTLTIYDATLNFHIRGRDSVSLIRSSVPSYDLLCIDKYIQND